MKSLVVVKLLLIFPELKIRLAFIGYLFGNCCTVYSEDDLSI